MDTISEDKDKKVIVNQIVKVVKEVLDPKDSLLRMEDYQSLRHQFLLFLKKFPWLECLASHVFDLFKM